MLAETLLERELNADVPYLMRKLAHHDIETSIQRSCAVGPSITGEFYAALEKYPTQPSDELFAFMEKLKILVDRHISFDLSIGG